MPLLLTSVVERPPLGAATGQSSFEFAAYCQKLCVWGRGGNLCRCNAVHFVGKRRTFNLPMHVRFDRSVDVADDEDDEAAAKKMDLIYLAPDRRILDGQLDAVDDSVRSTGSDGYRPDDDDVREGRRRRAAIDRQLNDVAAKKGIESTVGGTESKPEVGQPDTESVSVVRNRPRHRRKTYSSIKEVGSGTSVGPVINVFYRRPDYGGEAAPSKMTLVKSPPPSSPSLLLLRHDGIVLPSQEATAK